MRLLDGKAVAEFVKSRLKERISTMNVQPGLAAILVGDNPASRIYVDIKQKTCREVGIYSEMHALPASVEEDELVSLIRELNAKESVHGILVQLPLPPHISNSVLSEVSVAKDVDGFTPENVAALASGRECVVPCTPKGIVRLLEHYGVGISGKDAVVVGRSITVGRPVASMLLNRDASVSVCHSRTPDLGAYTSRADILVAAAGVPGLVGAGMVKRGAVVVDVGISRVGGKLVGDVDFEGVKDRTSFITPVPGGVGPMTVAMLLENTVLCCERAA